MRNYYTFFTINFEMMEICFNFTKQVHPLGRSGVAFGRIDRDESTIYIKTAHEEQTLSHSVDVVDIDWP